MPCRSGRPFLGRFSPTAAAGAGCWTRSSLAATDPLLRGHVRLPSQLPPVRGGVVMGPAGRGWRGRGGADPLVLAVGEGHGIPRAASHNGPLEDRIASAQDRVGPQGVPEAPYGGYLSARRAEGGAMRPRRAF